MADIRPTVFCDGVIEAQVAHGVARISLAVTGSDAVAERQIEAAIREAGGKTLRSVRLFDLYDQPPIPKGQRSLAYSLEFRDDNRTLTDKEVDEAFAAIVRALQEKYAYQLR